MKKLVISVVVFALAILWCIKFSSLNHGFKVNSNYPIEYYSMNEQVRFEDNMSYGGVDNKGYSISLENANIVEMDDILKDPYFQNDYNQYGQKCLILTCTIFNEGTAESEFNLLSLPVMGLDWYTVSSFNITKYLNFDKRDIISYDGCVTIPKGQSIELNVAYDLYRVNFSKKNWDKLQELDVWVWATLRPVDRRIKISF